MSYAVFFRDEEEKLTLRLPINPEEINQNRELETEEFSVLKLGKIIKVGDIGLLNIEFEAQFPSEVSSLVETPNEFKNADYYKNKFDNWMNDKKAIRFICTNGISKDLSLLVVIKSLDIREVAGEEGDYYIKFSLIEYKPYALKVLENNPSIVYKPPTPERTANPPQPSNKTYTIVSGDTLWGISKRFLGNGARYMEIYNINKPPLGGNPNLIYPGQQIKIP